MRQMEAGIGGSHAVNEFYAIVPHFMLKSLMHGRRWFPCYFVNLYIYEKSVKTFFCWESGKGDFCHIEKAQLILKP